MNRTAKAIALLVLCLQTAVAQVTAPSYNHQPRFDPARRTLQQKVKDAQLIVFGTASAFGTNLPLILDTHEFYGQNIRVSIAAVLWPPTHIDTSDVVFRHDAYPNWLRHYSNSPGVFFLTKNMYPERGEWDQLPYFDDWMEAPTNLLAVLRCIQMQKGTPSLSGLLQVPPPKFRQMSQYGHTQAASDYESSFREGYFAALTGKHGLWMFGPTNEADKVKTLGYADGQSAGDAAWSAWLRKHQQK